MKVGTVGKSLPEVIWAYLAGLIDGDGAIMATIERHPEKRYRFRVRVTVKVTSFRKPDVAWLLQTINVGGLRPNRRTYEWIVRDQTIAYWILCHIAPYTRWKRQQTKIALRLLQQTIKKKSDLLRCAQMADALSMFNVRSRNRRKNFTAMIQESDSRND